MDIDNKEDYYTPILYNLKYKNISCIPTDIIGIIISFIIYDLKIGDFVYALDNRYPNCKGKIYHSYIFNIVSADNPMYGIHYIGWGAAQHTYLTADQIIQHDEISDYQLYFQPTLNISSLNELIGQEDIQKIMLFEKDKDSDMKYKKRTIDYQSPLQFSNMQLYSYMIFNQMLHIFVTNL